ncbi:hypothetical protein MKW98_017565 [Papaver atlanticum]|uniref:Uncharacterized protein n=1 Tax=Papaver atlanticum TaxID=357466 RepID=A0AAD4TEP7_9MAGN|nr:hypothetical protein MKW98_017565 [Papaver atlanticum]
MEGIFSNRNKKLLLEHEIYVGESVDDDWKSSSIESFELVGSVLKKATMIEKVIDEKLEETPIDSSSEMNFFQKSSIPGATDEEIPL